MLFTVEGHNRQKEIENGACQYVIYRNADKHYC